jgi:hypothetical protein
MEAKYLALEAEVGLVLQPEAHEPQAERVLRLNNKPRNAVSVKLITICEQSLRFSSLFEFLHWKIVVFFSVWDLQTEEKGTR